MEKVLTVFTTLLLALPVAQRADGAFGDAAEAAKRAWESAPAGKKARGSNSGVNRGASERKSYK